GVASGGGGQAGAGVAPVGRVFLRRARDADDAPATGAGVLLAGQVERQLDRIVALRAVELDEVGRLLDLLRLVRKCGQGGGFNVFGRLLGLGRGRRVAEDLALGIDDTGS